VSAPFVVLVEGIDDQEVVKHLLRQHGLTEIVVERTDGSAALLASIPVRPKASDLEALAIVVDADVDIAGRWQSIRDNLRNIGYANCPHEPDSGGTIVSEHNRPLVGIWIMPDNTPTGILEEFVASLVPQGDALWSRVQHCIDSVPSEL
jgi:hypothetical protein